MKTRSKAIAAYLCEYNGERIFCAHNLSHRRKPVKVRLPYETMIPAQILGKNLSWGVSGGEFDFELDAYEFVWFSIRDRG